MARFSLAADVMPTVDEGAAEREGKQLAQTLEDEVGDLGVGVDGGGVGGLGGARGGGGAAGAAGAAAGGSLLGKGAAAGGLATVALGGAVGFGLLTGIQTLASASPALKQTNALFGEAMERFFRPFGKELSETFRPFAKEALDMAVNFNDIYESDGLGVALLSLGGDVAKTIGGGVANAIAETVMGDASQSDLVTVGLVGITAAKLAGILPSIGIGSILTGLTGGSLTSLLGSTGIGSTLSGLTSGSLAGLLGQVGLTTVVGSVASVAVLFTSVASLHDVMDGDISDWNLPGKFGEALGKGFKNKWPDMASKIRGTFKNVFSDTTDDDEVDLGVTSVPVPDTGPGITAPVQLREEFLARGLGRNGKKGQIDTPQEREIFQSALENVQSGESIDDALRSALNEFVGYQQETNQKLDDMIQVLEQFGVSATGEFDPF